jgi:hypothetical protein
MPINKTLLKSLRKMYGKEKGDEVYRKMEADGELRFTKGLETAIKEGHTQKYIRRTKKGKK